MSFVYSPAISTDLFSHSGLSSSFGMTMLETASNIVVPDQ